MITFAALALLAQPTPAARVIRFSGYDWTVKDSGKEKVGPGGNYFSSAKDLVSVDSTGRLHLTITKGDQGWLCTEVVCAKPLGYGTYRWVIDQGLDALPASMVLGLFTWSDAEPYAHQEIDFEASRWGDPNSPDAQFVIQPYDSPGNMKRFEIGDTKLPHRFEFTWREGRVDFVAFVLKDHRWLQRTSWKNEGSAVPKFVDAAARMNLWLFQSKAPDEGHRVVIRSFTFRPLNN